MCDIDIYHLACQTCQLQPYDKRARLDLPKKLNNLARHKSSKQLLKAFFLAFSSTPSGTVAQAFK
jgi:hypothetical protein